MVYCRRKLLKLLRSIACLAVFLPVIVTLYITRPNVDVTTLCLSMQHGGNQPSKYIFDLYKWQEIMQKEVMLSKRNETLWCDVPADLQFLSYGICRSYDIRDCTRLPCRLIYSSATTLEDVKCSHHGRNTRATDNMSDQKQSNYECKAGFSLDLFRKKFQESSYPSLMADPYVRFSDDLYIHVLNNYYRSCASIWGFHFRYESISYYPWTADRDKLKMFDVTFGYDRSIHDFMPSPHLYMYVEQIKFTSKRLTVQQAMNSKASFHSVTKSDVYWTSSSVSSATQNETNSTSYINAPILWMNSNCRPRSGRSMYIMDLMKHIDIDNYGTCAKNIRPLPKHIVDIQGSANRTLNRIITYNWQAGKLALSREYLFTIAIENSLNYDYISEKLWHPLIAGSVPIYLGAPNIYDWLPCRTNCIIDLRQFKTPKDAAMFIKTVAKNKTLYETYHHWRNEPVSENFQNMLNYNTRISNYSLECALCEMSHRVAQGEDRIEVRKELKKTVGYF